MVRTIQQLEHVRRTNIKEHQDIVAKINELIDASEEFPPLEPGKYLKVNSDGKLEWATVETGSAVWGQITGNLTNQTDVNERFRTLTDGLIRLTAEIGSVGLEGSVRDDIDKLKTADEGLETDIESLEDEIGAVGQTGTIRDDIDKLKTEDESLDSRVTANEEAITEIDQDIIDLENGTVKTTGNQTIDGTKTFSSTLIKIGNLSIGSVASGEAKFASLSVPVTGASGSTQFQVWRSPTEGYVVYQPYPPAYDPTASNRLLNVGHLENRFNSKIRKGPTAPSDSFGDNGDIYIQYEA